MSGGKDRISSLLAYSVKRSGDEHARNVREHARVDNTQVLNAPNLELTVEDSHGVIIRPHLGRAAQVVAEDVGAEELPKLLVGLVLRTGKVA
jgi:hypothetical protein